VDIEDAIRRIATEEVERILAARERESAKKKWLSVKECADYLGISEMAVRRRITRGRIPVRHQGRSVLVDRVALDRQIDGSW
jgi:excisionase family DNA binding protein